MQRHPNAAMRNRLLLSAALLACLTGCGNINRSVAKYTGVAKACIGGVTYLQFASGATVQVDRSGTPVPCGNP
jgi:hypothetical protein